MSAGPREHPPRPTLTDLAERAGAHLPPSSITPEAQAEIDDFRRWLALPKPRPEFHAWRATQTADA